MFSLIPVLNGLMGKIGVGTKNRRVLKENVEWRITGDQSRAISITYFFPSEF